MSLRLKLILMLLLFSLIPTFQLYLSARSMLSSTLAVGLNQDVAGALTKAHEVSLKLTDKEKEKMAGDLSQISENEALAAAILSGDALMLGRMLKSFRQRFPVGVLCAYDLSGRRLAKDPPEAGEPLSRPERQAGSSWEVPQVLEFDSLGGFVRGGAPVFRSGKRVGFIAAKSPLGSFYRERLGVILGTLEDYADLMAARDEITRGLAARLRGTLAMMLGLALLFAFYVTRALLVPVRRLSEAAEALSYGRYEGRIPETGGGELADLARMFNRMTERLGAVQEKLSRASREEAWREAAQTIAHEIKNPLTPMALAMEDLRDRAGKKGGGKRVVDATTVVLGEIDNLRRLASVFSQFARLPRARPRVQSVSKLLDRAAELYGPGKRLAYGGTRVERSVLADPGLIQQALLNLIENGLKASPPGRPVSLSLIESGGDHPPLARGLGSRNWILPPESAASYVWILVTDRGRGIAKGDIPRIFEPHVSLAPGGSGLGLALVRRIADDHGAALGIQSRLGRGTAFFVGLREAPREG